MNKLFPIIIWLSFILSQGNYQILSTPSNFNNTFKICDAILTPTTPTGAFEIGEKNDDPVAMYLNDIFTVPASLAGLPAISIPAGLDHNKRPLGLQLIGRPFDEESIISVASVIEDSANFRDIEIKEGIVK